MSKLYAVLAVEDKGAVAISPGAEVEIGLQWAEGMVGCIPVFISREAAAEYANATAGILELGRDPRS